MSGFVGRQRGLGMLGALVVTLGVRLGPPYMQYLTVKSAMNAVSEDVELKGKGRTEVMSALGRRLDVNSVSGLPPQAFRVEQKDFGQKLIADYEVRVHLFFNIDAVLSFDYQVALGRQ
jgi:hypothetical protein